MNKKTGKTYKKIIVVNYTFAINELPHKITKEFIELLKQMSNSQAIIINTYNNINTMLKFFSKDKPYNIYIISDGGALIYSLKKQIFLEEKTIDQNAVKAVVHLGVSKGQSIILNGKENQMIYSFAPTDAKVFSDYSLEFTHSYDEVCDFILSSNIYSIDLFSTTNILPKSLIQKVKKTLRSDWNIGVEYIESEKLFSISDISCLFFNKVTNVLESEGVKTLDDVLLITLTPIEIQNILYFKNSIFYGATKDLFSDIHDKKIFNSPKELKNLLDDNLGLYSNSFFKTKKTIDKQ